MIERLEGNGAQQMNEGQLRRRRDDVMNSRTMFDMVRFLMTRPTGDQIAQHLVLNLLKGHSPRAVVVSLFGADGSLQAVGSFGVSPEGLEPYKALSLWDISPMSDAVRTGDPIIMGSALEMEERYPWIESTENPYEPMAVWPLSLPSQRVGAVQISFESAPDDEALRADLTGLAAILALYLSLLTGASAAASGVRASHSLDEKNRSSEFGSVGISLVPALVQGEAQPTFRRSAPDSLSERQLRILSLMSSGLTNGQISKRIGFSESTVRQETMAIYRYFGVGGRREAIRLAGMRGMLDANVG